MTCDAAWQCGQVVKMNSSAITLPRYWLRSSWPFPGTVNATSGAFRIAGASVLAANVEAENTNTPMKESSACFKPFSPRFQCNGSLFESFRAFGSGPVASAGAVTAFCDSSQNFFLSNSEGVAALPVVQGRQKSFWPGVSVCFTEFASGCVPEATRQ